MSEALKPLQSIDNFAPLRDKDPKLGIHILEHLGSELRAYYERLSLSPKPASITEPSERISDEQLAAIPKRQQRRSAA
jgi:hypothetical protein